MQAMDRDDKILEMLVNLSNGQTRLETKIEKLETDVSELKISVKKLETSVEKLETSVEKLETSVEKLEIQLANVETDTKSQIERLSQSVAVIEVEHGKMLGVLSDGYSLMSDNIKKLLPPDETEDLVTDVSMLKKVVTSHSQTFQKMKAAI